MCDRIEWKEWIVSGKVDGRINVVFKCRWWSKDVEIEMVSPYPGIKDGTDMLLAVPTRYGESAGFIYWQDVAWGLVRGIIAREEWKCQHRCVYEERLKESRRKREEIFGEIEKLKDGLDEARRSRIGGWCGAILYGSKVEQLNEKIRELEQMAMEEEEWRWLPKLMESDKRLRRDVPAKNMFRYQQGHWLALTDKTEEIENTLARS